MKILITGSAGFIGQWVRDRLATAGLNVVGVDHNPVVDPRWVATHHVCDILDASQVREIFLTEQPEAVIHLAAHTYAEKVQEASAYTTNIEGVRNVLAAMQACGSVRRAIFTSSMLVCRVGYVPRHDSDYCPNTAYGESKVWTEKIVREAGGACPEWCVVRPTTVWGPYMKKHYQRMLHYIRRGTYFHVGRRPLQKTYAYAGNIAYQYFRLLLAPAEHIHGLVFYLADYEPLSLRAYADLLARELGARPIPTLPLPVVHLLARLGDLLGVLGWQRFPFNSFRLRNILTEYQMPLERTRQVCGPVPFSFEDGVKATAAWFRELTAATH